MTDVSGMAYGPDGGITVRFNQEGLERLLDALNDNSRGEAYGYVQYAPGTAEIVFNKLSWAQRLYATALRQENRN